MVDFVKSRRFINNYTMWRSQIITTLTWYQTIIFHVWKGRVVTISSLKSGFIDQVNTPSYHIHPRLPLTQKDEEGPVDKLIHFLQPYKWDWEFLFFCSLNGFGTWIWWVLSWWELHTSHVFLCVSSASCYSCSCKNFIRWLN